MRAKALARARATSTTAPASSAPPIGPFDTAGEAKDAGHRALGAALKDQPDTPGERGFTGTNDPSQFHDESDTSWRPYGAGDIASGDSAMHATPSGTVYDSTTDHGYRDPDMTGSTGGSMQGGANVSFGRPGAQGPPGEPAAEPGDEDRPRGQQPVEGAAERQKRGDTPTPDPGGEYPDTGAEE